MSGREAHYLPSGGGGGGGLPYVCILGMCRARDPHAFPALNFRSGAYNFHKRQKYPLRSITILHFLPLRRPSFSKFRYVQAIHSRPPQRPGVSDRPDLPARRVLQVSSEDPHFHARTRSGAPHFPLLPWHIATKMWCECPPPRPLFD